MKEILLTEKEMVFLVLLYFHEYNHSSYLPSLVYLDWGRIVRYTIKPLPSFLTQNTDAKL